MWACLLMCLSITLAAHPGRAVLSDIQDMQTPPGASVPSVLSRQDCPGDALEHHVSYDMDAAAALGWATAGFGGTVCDFHHVKAQGAWFEKHGIPEFLQRAIDFGGHILLRAPTLDSQNTLRELLKTIIRAHLIPDAPTLGAPDLCNQALPQSR